MLPSVAQSPSPSSEHAAYREVNTAALIAPAVIQAQRANGGIEGNAHAYTAMKVSSMGQHAVIPGTTAISEDSALNLIGQGEPVLYGQDAHAVATELVVTIAAQGILAAHTELVEL